MLMMLSQWLFTQMSSKASRTGLVDPVLGGPLFQGGSKYFSANQNPNSYMGSGIGGRGAIALPPLFQICELGGLASHCVNLETLACNTTHIYLDI